MTAHRWSGWPGAWCLDCGVEDTTEIAIADGALFVNEREEWEWEPGKKELYMPSECPCPYAGDFNPYVRRDWECESLPTPHELYVVFGIEL